MIIAYVIGIVFFLFSFGLLLLMVVGRFYGRKRENLMTNWAESAGMTYQKKDEGLLFAKNLEGFALGGDSELKGAMNIMQGEGQGFKTSIFDYFRHLEKKNLASRTLFSAVLFEDPKWHWTPAQLTPKLI
ncbi:MAG TPA: hypothetical protein DCP28_03270, partial [Cytophagales bacterium]|nr:hypothetical protein [Cytophagales bacterium]